MNRTYALKEWHDLQLENAWTACFQGWRYTNAHLSVLFHLASVVFFHFVTMLFHSPHANSIEQWFFSYIFERAIYMLYY